MSYIAPDVAAELSTEEFILMVHEQFREIQRAFVAGRPPVLREAPKNPRNGWIVIADGTGWNPGSGAGYYGFYNGTWRFLG